MVNWRRRTAEDTVDSERNRFCYDLENLNNIL